ncbi:MAG: thiamine pyrophosphate-binding protein, partial [Limnochordales bacterium]
MNGGHRVQQAAYAYVGAFVDELARAGVRHVCICPGSRSTPLAMLAAEHPDVRVWMHIDERSAAFFALGLAKATGTPVALVATSGTAVVNFMPAVVEAYYSRVPLLLLTADRPPELRDVGTNQTIDQVRLYGGHVKWSVDMPLPEAVVQLSGAWQTSDTLLVPQGQTRVEGSVARASFAVSGPQGQGALHV